MIIRKTPLRLNLSLLLIFTACLILPQIALTADNSRTPADKKRHATAASARPERQSPAASAYEKLPLQFEVNRGQADRKVRFLSRGSGYNLFLTQAEAVVVLQRDGANQSSVLRLRLEGANPQPRIEGQERLAGYSNYFTGNDPARWHTAIPNYQSVAYREVYPGIDVIYYGNQRQLEYDFRLAAGADPHRIKLNVKGADSLKLDDEGNLLIETGAGRVVQHRAVAYQEIDGIRHNVRCSYELTNQREVRFSTGDYDRSRPLIIDPILAYSSYLGGSGNDEANGIAVDSTGAVYLTGHTESLNFPTSAGAYQTTRRGSRNVFITKLNGAGTAIIYSTYLGGSGSDDAFAIAVDASGSAYVTGQILSYNFPLTLGLGTTGTPGDVFVTRLTPDGRGLIYSTAIGGSRDDVGYGIAVDSNSNASVVGRTYSNNFPVAAALQPSKSGSPATPDAFALKLNPAGNNLIFSTFLGGTDHDAANSVALDAQGNILLTGLTASPSFPTSAGAFQVNNAGLYDAFVSKLSSDGSALLYSTYLGGSGNDEGRAIVVDAQGAFYVAGDGDSFDFPTSSGAYQSQPAGSLDIFVARFGAGGTLAYNTFIGGTGMDFARGIVVDGAGFASVCGETASSDYPTTPSALQNLPGGGNDAFVTRLNQNASALSYSTFLGGNLDESGAGLALDSSNNLYLTGYTASSNFNTTPDSLQPVNRGLTDAFIVKLTPDPTFEINGQIRDTTGAPLANATISINGTQTATATTDSGGFYTVSGLMRGPYTVTPSLDYHTFEPQTINLYLLDTNLMADFTATRQTFHIFGRTTDTNGNALANVTLALSGDSTSSVTSDSGGFYRFTGLPAGGSYTVTATLTDYEFTPPSTTVNPLTSFHNAEFTGAYQRFDIFGRTTDANGSALPGTLISVRSPLGGPTIATATTDATGFYRINGIRTGDYVVTPSLVDYRFTPQSLNVSLTRNQPAEFVGTFERHDIFGRVTSSTGSALSNATITLTGPENATTTTDANGFYRFSNVRDGGPYTLTPALVDYAFTPQSSVINQLDAMTPVDFTGVYQRHDIFGRIVSGSGSPLANVTIALSGQESATATTDSNGFYRLTNVHDGGPYTLTPSLADYIFAPQSYTILSLTSNQPVEFTGIYQRFDITGRLTDNMGAPLANAIVTLSDSQPSVMLTVTTDAGGFYAFRSIAAGGPYTITPALSYFNFTPQGSTIAALAENRVVEFTGTRQAYDISGRVLDNSGNPLASATVTLGGAQSATTTTDASGNYVFQALPAGFSYTLTPALLYYNLDPQTTTVNPLSANRSIDFAATRQTFEINGRVTDAQGVALSNVTVNLTGAREATTTTDATGYYRLRDLPAGYSYTVSPFGSYHDYSPASSTVNPLTVNRSIDFAGTRQRYVVDGFVKDLLGNPLSNASVTLSGAQTMSATTNVNGYYRFDGVFAGYSYTVTAALPYYTLSPQSVAIDTLSMNRMANFTATRQVYSINGRVTDAQGAALAGVAVNLGGAQGGTVQTDMSGNYSFAGLPAGYSYTVTPVYAGYSFAPQSASVNPLAQNSTANFNAARNLYTITGSVADACGAPMSGVTVALSGGKTMTTMTDASGSYTFTALPSLLNYTVTPTRAGFALTPVNAQFNNLLGNQTGVNFTSRPTLTTLNPLADAYVFDANPSTNFGTATQLITRTRSNNNNQSFLKFDLANFCGANRVVLRVYGRLSDTKMTSLALDVYGVPNTTWSETTLTWNNRPANSATLQQTVQVTGTTARWYDLDITAYVKSELLAGRRTISLLLKNGTTSSTNSTSTLLDSREAVNKPQLVVTAP